VRLGDVADVRVAPTAAVIQRDAVSRRVDVEAGISGRGLDSVAGDIEARLAKLSFPLEYHAQVLTHTTASEIGSTRMLGFAIACLMAIFLLLQAAFRSWRLATLAFLTLPVALVGGVLAALVNGAELSLGAAAAFLALFGLAARNGVMLIRHLQELEREGMAFGVELVRRGAQDRLAAILTTAAGLALLALPFVIMGSRPGLEVVHPMAVVLLGGLLSTTLLSLFVLPALYARFAAGREPDMAADDELLHRWAGVEPGSLATAGVAAQTLPDEVQRTRIRPDAVPVDESVSPAATKERSE